MEKRRKSVKRFREKAESFNGKNAEPQQSRMIQHSTALVVEGRELITRQTGRADAAFLLL